jgi:hypothetical protein
MCSPTFLSAGDLAALVVGRIVLGMVGSAERDGEVERSALTLSAASQLRGRMGARRRELKVASATCGHQSGEQLTPGADAVAWDAMMVGIKVEAAPFRVGNRPGATNRHNAGTEIECRNAKPPLA